MFMMICWNKTIIISQSVLMSYSGRALQLNIAYCAGRVVWMCHLVMNKAKNRTSVLIKSTETVLFQRWFQSRSVIVHVAFDIY